MRNLFFTNFVEISFYYNGLWRLKGLTCARKQTYHPTCCKKSAFCKQSALVIFFFFQLMEGFFLSNFITTIPVKIYKKISNSPFWQNILTHHLIITYFLLGCKIYPSYLSISGTSFIRSTSTFSSIQIPDHNQLSDSN